MSTDRVDLEQFVRARIAKPINEAFLKDALDTLANRLDQLEAWPSRITDLDVVILPPGQVKSDPLLQRGYAGWTVPDPRGGPHLSALFEFDPKKYISVA